MTGRVGNQRSVRFPIINAEGKSEAPHPGYPVSPLIVYQNLQRDTKLIGDRLKVLGADEGGLHGDLQVLLSAARRIEADLELLLAIEEGESLKTRSAGGSQ